MNGASFFSRAELPSVQGGGFNPFRYGASFISGTGLPSFQERLSFFQERGFLLFRDRVSFVSGIMESDAQKNLNDIQL
jgi:hypothetical protein